MWFKVLLNVLYNVCIFICLLFTFYSIKNHNWPYVLGGVFLGAMVIIFKLRLIKDIRNRQEKTVTSTKKGR
jgi:Na+/melibiose symporter-like transporter